MKVRVKGPTEDDDGRYVEIDLTDEDMENIKKGRYPVKYATIEGKHYTLSVGYEG